MLQPQTPPHRPSGCGRLRVLRGGLPHDRSLAKTGSLRHRGAGVGVRSAGGSGKRLVGLGQLGLGEQARRVRFSPGI